MTNMTIQQQIEAANARGVGQFHLVRGCNVVSTHRGYDSTVALAKVRGGAVYNDSGERVAGPYEPTLDHPRAALREIELAVMPLREAGEHERARHLLEAADAVAELIRAADAVVNGAAPAKEQLAAALARVQGEG